MAKALSNDERAEWLLAKVREVVGEHCHDFVFSAEIDWPTKTNPDGRRVVANYGNSLNSALGLSGRLDKWLQMQADLEDEDGPFEGGTPDSPESEGCPVE